MENSVAWDKALTLLGFAPPLLLLVVAVIGGVTLLLRKALPGGDQREGLESQRGANIL
ncbi:MAG: hypothetical protein P4N59_15595 [Negativicutes bacterium]|nr:hypothetical protein [Negativicutes bacterium]